MEKNIIKIPALIAFMFLLVSLNFSCSKDYHDAEPQLEISVRDNNSLLPVSGAKVVLYGTETTYFNDMDTLRVGYTGDDGKCLFTSLNEVPYYFSVKYGNKTNAASVFYTDSLEAGKRFVVISMIK